MNCVKCDHCGKTEPLREAARDGWFALATIHAEGHFCSTDCLLFWAAKTEAHA